MSTPRTGRTAAEALHLSWIQILHRFPEGGAPLSRVDLEELLASAAPDGEVRERAWLALQIHLTRRGADCARPELLEFWLRNTPRSLVRELLAEAGATAALLHLDALLPERFGPEDSWGFPELHRLLRVECRAAGWVETVTVNALAAAVPEDPDTRLRPGLSEWLHDASREERLALVHQATYSRVPSAVEVLSRARSLQAERPPEPGGHITCGQLFALLPEAGAVGRVLERAEHALLLGLARASGTEVLAQVAGLYTPHLSVALEALDVAQLTAALLLLEAVFPVYVKPGEECTLEELHRLLCEVCGASEAQAEACLTELRAVWARQPHEAGAPTTLEAWLPAVSPEEVQDLLHSASHHARDPQEVRAALCDDETEVAP